MSLLLLLLLLLLLTTTTTTTATNNTNHLTSFTSSNSPWSPSQNITLFSPNHTFAAGFLRLPSSRSLFNFSIWVHTSNSKTVVWSLNLTTPISSSSQLFITPNGTLVLRDPTRNVNNNLFPPTSNDTQLVLHDNGSLVFANWTSFDYPTHTILANQPISTTGVALVSNNYQLVNATSLLFNNTDSYWSFSGTIKNLTVDGNLTVTSGNLITSDVGRIVLRRLTLDPDGNLRVYSLDDKGDWLVVWQAVWEPCGIYGICGYNEICMPNRIGNSTTCECPPGYQKAAAGGGGCDLKDSYLHTNSKFLRLDFVDFDFNLQPNSSSVNFDTCKSSCLANSSCVAFSYEFNGGRTCITRFKQLKYGRWSPPLDRSTFLRVSNAVPDPGTLWGGMTSMINTKCPVNISLQVPPSGTKTTARNVSIIATLFSLELLAGILSFWAFLRKYSKYRDMARTFGLEFLPAGGPKRFSYAELKAATNDFSDVVGSGGFGVVYKGMLSDGRIIAVKTLKSGAGGVEAEFWREVTIIARMHHLNLVRMWGFCAEKKQRMLVYEYIPNGSLDKFLFRQEEEGAIRIEDQQNEEETAILQKRRPTTLDWSIRYRIALGVARAIAYLHEECLEWVLHCDIKPENILLEDDFCPKVSDFGLSKLTNKKDIMTMSKIRGTRGYLAPEWVTHRVPISAKADVYSFGVVLLEIVTGVRNSTFQRSSMESEDWYFPRWAYEKVYEERRVEDMLDPVILASYDDREHFPMVERMVKTAMWCLQDQAETRPSMGKVAKMLEGSVEITTPDKPAIFYITA